MMFVRARVTKERVRVWKRVCADMKEGINCCGIALVTFLEDKRGRGCVGAYPYCAD